MHNCDSIDLVGTLSVGRGPMGPVGPMGPPGKDGIDGTVSFDKLTPDQKLQLKGEKGDRGDKGETGDQGPIGLTGPKGDQGIQGIKGETGDQGPRGFEGPRGLTGPEGPQGEKGDPGQDGEGDRIRSIAITTPGLKNGTIREYYDQEKPLDILRQHVEYKHNKTRSRLQVGEKVVGMFIGGADPHPTKATLEVADVGDRHYSFNIFGMSTNLENLDDIPTKTQFEELKGQIDTKFATHDLKFDILYKTSVIPEHNNGKEGLLKIGNSYGIQWFNNVGLTNRDHRINFNKLQDGEVYTAWYSIRGQQASGKVGFEPLYNLSNTIRFYTEQPGIIINAFAIGKVK